ncbi:MAG: tetratricopeptide repeat protein [Planctomycetes bacterium]|nr:tetratricopeptide repeat protein [Planctomycetota bacterium]
MKRGLLLLLLLVPACVTVEDPCTSVWQDTNSAVHERLAQAALERGRFADACASAREALRVDPRRTEAVLILTRALLYSGAPQEAEAAARRALELAPESSQAWLLCAESVLAQEREEEARALYRRAADLGAGEAAFVLGALELANGDEAAAAALLENREGRSAAPGAAAVLATHYWLAGRPAHALNLLERARARAPEDRGLELKTRQVRFALGDRASIAQQFGRERAAGKTASLEERCLAAAALLGSGDAPGAAAEYRRLARALPDEPRIRLALGEALLLEGDAAGAEAAFENAARLDPAARAPQVGIARSLLAAGEDARAIAALERALRIEPGHVPTRCLLAAAWAQSGDRDRARREAEEVRVLSPGSALDHACRRMLQRTESRTADESAQTR